MPQPAFREQAGAVVKLERQVEPKLPEARFVLEEQTPDLPLVSRFPTFVSRRRGPIPISTENERRCLRTTLALERLLREADFPWSVVGGLGNDLRNGVISRVHTDVEIEVALGDAERVIQFFSDRQRYITHCDFRFPLTLRNVACFFSPAELEHCELAQHPPLKVVLPSKEGWLPYIDVFFCRHHERGTEIGWKGREWILPFAYRGERDVAWINDRQIPLRNPLFFGFLASVIGRPKSKHDLRVVEKMVGADGMRLLAETISSFKDRRLL